MLPAHLYKTSNNGHKYRLRVTGLFAMRGYQTVSGTMAAHVRVCVDDLPVARQHSAYVAPRPGRLRHSRGRVQTERGHRRRGASWVDLIWFTLPRVLSFGLSVGQTRVPTRIHLHVIWRLFSACSRSASWEVTLLTTRPRSARIARAWTVAVVGRGGLGRLCSAVPLWPDLSY